MDNGQISESSSQTAAHFYFTPFWALKDHKWDHGCVPVIGSVPRSAACAVGQWSPGRSSVPGSSAGKINQHSLAPCHQPSKILSRSRSWPQSKNAAEHHEGIHSQEEIGSFKDKALARDENNFTYLSWLCRQAHTCTHMSQFVINGGGEFLISVWLLHTIEHSTSSSCLREAEPAGERTQRQTQRMSGGPIPWQHTLRRTFLCLETVCGTNLRCECAGDNQTLYNDNRCWPEQELVRHSG